MTDKQLTPMQELIQWIDSKTDERGNTRLNNFDIMDKAKELLPKEKRVIEDAWYDGTENMDCINASTYYNNKFKND